MITIDIYDVGGLPLHVLLVHVVVIFVPVTALCVVLATLWPTARRRLGIVTALLGALVIAVVPVTTQAGQWLKDRVPETPLIDAHAHLGAMLWPWSLSLGILAIAVWLWYFILRRRDQRTAGDTAGEKRRPSAVVRRVVAVLFIVLALGIGTYATVLTVQIGEAGSRAIWQNSFSDTPLR